MATILIAEDDRIALRTISFILNRAGHRVVAAADGQAALEQLAKTTVDLLIADLSMPRMDGLMLLRRLQAENRLSSLPVIVLTASADGDKLTQVTQTGVEIILTKPVGKQHLLDTVAGLLGAADI